MNVWRVESRWSSELVVAKTIAEAMRKYEKYTEKEMNDHCAPVASADRKVTRVTLEGTAIA